MKLPYEFDLFWDCKTHGDSIRMLRHLRKQVRDSSKKYKALHACLRRHRLGVDGLPPKIGK